MKQRYYVDTETRGGLEFEDLPDQTYFYMGNVGHNPQAQLEKKIKF